MVAVLATVLTPMYLYYAIRLSKDAYDTVSFDQYDADRRKTRTIQWIISAIFTVMVILMSVSLMCKLRIRFEDFYAEYGCFLWVFFTIQALSMII